jgi:hypothetical protein
VSEVRGVTNQPTLCESRMGEMCIKYICLEVSRLVCVFVRHVVGQRESTARRGVSSQYGGAFSSFDAPRMECFLRSGDRETVSPAEI